MKTTTRHLRLIRSGDGRRVASRIEEPPQAPRFVVGSSGSARLPDMDERDLVQMARNHDRLAFELLMRRHNQRIYRIVRSVLKGSAEVEDVIQHAYLQAFAHLDQFDGSARWSTWVGRIAINEALARLRSRQRFVSFDAPEESAWPNTAEGSDRADPERAVTHRELGQLLERAIDDLPAIYRAVLIMRDIEGMSTHETAELLGVDEDVVKTRLHRARGAMRTAMENDLGEELRNSFVFGNERCDRVVAAVLLALDR